MAARSEDRLFSFFFLIPGMSSHDAQPFFSGRRRTRLLAAMLTFSLFSNAFCSFLEWVGAASAQLADAPTHSRRQKKKTPRRAHGRNHHRRLVSYVVQVSFTLALILHNREPKEEEEKSGDSEHGA
uniref:Uncharacterized protein n=1 Tax=Rhipicephalus zambeziensis TaxID=60191 RepID=A0A224YGU7_9ACAR